MPIQDERPGGAPSPGDLDLARDLAAVGYRDVLVLDRDDAAAVLTGRRMELLEEIQADEPDSVRALARRVGRDPGQVSRDLDLLFTRGIIDFDENGGRKIPVMRHEHVFVEPIV